MSVVSIEGGKPLLGSVTVSGARNSVLKLIPAAMFSNEDVILQNVPKINAVEDAITVVRSLGGKAEWAGSGRLILNASGIDTFEIPKEIGSRYRTSLLMAGPLLYRFGKAVIPSYRPVNTKPGPINRILDAWRALGVDITESSESIYLDGSNMHSNSVNFKLPSHLATDATLLCSVFLPGETVINNASEEVEVDDLIDLLNKIGARVVRTEPKIIKVTGSNIFRGTVKDVQPDKIEAAIFAIAAVLTKGNLLIKNVDRNSLIPLVNFLNKVGVRFEFEQDALKVWRHEEELSAVNLVVSPTPGFIPDWQSIATLLLTQCSGESLIHDTVYTDRFDYIKDLNRMGAKIELVKPGSVGLGSVVSDDTYDVEANGEPYSVARVLGPTKIHAEKLDISSFKFGAVQVLAALTAEGKSEVSGIEHVEAYVEGFTSKLLSLGAKIWNQWE